MSANPLAARPLAEDLPTPTLAEPGTRAPTRKVRLWDLPLRLYHWSLLAAVATALVTGKLGGEWMTLHGQAGIAVVGLLGFRLVWGLVGSSTSRFAHFLPGPRTLLAYLRGRWRGVGHNPLGALSVVALLGLIGWQAGSGLFSSDDIAFAGPLAGLIGEEGVQSLTGWHRQTVNLVFALLGLHVAAVLFHLKIKKDDIVTPMVTGDKALPADLPRPRPAGLIALAIAVAAGLGAGYAASGAWIEQEPAAAPASADPATPAPSAGAPAW